MGPLPMAGDAEGGGRGRHRGCLCCWAVLCCCKGTQGLQRDPAAVCFSQRVLSRVQVALQGSCSSTVSDMADLFRFISFFFPPLC